MRLSEAAGITGSFYELLRQEVISGNPNLGHREQSLLQGHYPVMMNRSHYPPKLASAIYVSRRSHAVQAIMGNKGHIVFDAGCGFGSESFLFASLGARVLAVDRSGEQIVIAEKRKQYFEEVFGRQLDITFEVADLNTYRPELQNISFIWLASVLAAIEDQNAFLERIHEETRIGGKVMITDMNLMNPLFFLNEWRRRRRAMKVSEEFSKEADFLKMFRREDRIGARYFRNNDGNFFDDVQFFYKGTLSRLLKSVGFTVTLSCFSGFAPPFLPSKSTVILESMFENIPFLCNFGYFYIVTGTKEGVR